MLEIDVLIESPRYAAAVDWQTLVSDAAIAAVEASDHAYLLAGDCTIELCVRLADDATIQPLNLESRGQNKPTNVLSFQYHEAEDLRQLAAQGGGLLGDLVLAIETIEREAKEQNKSIANHASHLIVHGVLHLLGLDHERSDDEAEAMEARERAAMAALGLPDPYGVHP